MLAGMVRTGSHQLRPAPGDTPEAVKVIARMHKMMIWEHTRAVQRLRHQGRADDRFGDPGTGAPFGRPERRNDSQELGGSRPAVAAAKVPSAVLNCTLWCERRFRRSRTVKTTVPMMAATMRIGTMIHGPMWKCRPLLEAMRVAVTRAGCTVCPSR
jgi:hypothetical protein